MARTTCEYGVLNIVAHPHGKGVYRQILDRAANKEVKFWGDLNAAVKVPREVEPGVLQSEIIVGVEIDLEEPLIDRSKLEEVSVDETAAEVSGNYLYNGKVFLYTFIEKDHLLFFESKNEFGKRLSPNRAHRIFTLLTSPVVIGIDAPRVDVTIVPDEDALDRILGLHRLDKVEIHLQRPNPGDEDAEEINVLLAELEGQGVATQDIRLLRAQEADSIALNVKNKIFAKAAALNGFVKAAGREADGSKFVGSTREYPKIIKAVIDAATPVSAAALRFAKRAAAQIKRANDS